MWSTISTVTLMLSRSRRCAPWRSAPASLRAGILGSQPLRSCARLLLRVAPEGRPFVEGPGVLVVAPRVDAIDGPTHEGRPTHTVDPGNGHRHPAPRLTIGVEASTGGVLGIDGD